MILSIDDSRGFRKQGKVDSHREVGFSQPEANVNQVPFCAVTKRFWEPTLREAAPAILAAHASTSEGLNAICEEMRHIAQDGRLMADFRRLTAH